MQIDPALPLGVDALRTILPVSYKLVNEGQQEKTLEKIYQTQDPMFEEMLEGRRRSKTYKCKCYTEY